MVIEFDGSLSNGVLFQPSPSGKSHTLYAWCEGRKLISANVNGKEIDLEAARQESNEDGRTLDLLMPGWRDGKIFDRLMPGGQEDES